VSRPLPNGYRTHHFGACDLLCAIAYARISQPRCPHPRRSPQLPLRRKLAHSRRGRVHCRQEGAARRYRDRHGNPREIITILKGDPRFASGSPFRSVVSGQRYARMTARLDENCGADGWAMTPSGTRGVLNDAASIYFLDTTLAGAFVARWCAGYRVETAGGVFQVREDDPAPRVAAALHRTP
jgi:hypothetical protein